MPHRPIVQPRYTHRGPLLTVDVAERTAETESVDDVLRELPGGRGLNTGLADEREPFDVDPLGPANRVYFTTGPMQ
ncbi:aldehyde ferredoxin oxidoreductase N-terminal domain-containing protein [Haloparvum sp. PAK95]|uniref:aldehyde ferredoxin oxidoreductase N-terminal domain-containing protein n=1 Tax=Haloparvum sp. PAK95 TaxID=3418962 RepID=UPI003D2EB979